MALGRQVARDGKSIRYVIGAAFVVATAAHPAHAAEVADAAEASTSDAIIVTGTRRAERTRSDSSVPVDVLTKNDLHGATPSPDLNNKLANLVPSFNVQRLPAFDGASFVRPATLRGLSPDQTLVLINGKRRHRSAYIDVAQQGEQAVDLAQIPEIALGRIEVLRDGASAQYGSDAIAGVINLILDESVGYTLDAQTGQYYKGDGESYQFAGRAGIALGNKGFLSGSAEYISLGETSRSNTVQKVGQPRVESWKIFANAQFALTPNLDLYGFGNLNRTRSRGEFNYRSPGGSIYAPSFYQINPPFIYPSFRLSDIYPNGFVPVFGARSQDASLVAGLRGNISPTLSWDISGRYGRNYIRYDIADTINASLGPTSPRSFHVGSQSQTEVAANADFTWLAEVGLAKPISFSFGGEWRQERYRIGVGDLAAYIVGPLSDLPPGANGYPSPTPDQAGHWARESRAAYIDADIDFTNRFDFGAALRFEDFDDFGSTWNYKLSARYKVLPWLNIRSAISTGFHAPTIGQQNLTNTTQAPDPRTPPPAPQNIISSGLIPSTNPIAMAVGGKPLVPEKATSFSGGFVLTLASGFTLSLDYYRIHIRKRLGLTSYIELTPEQRATLIAQGVSQAAQLSLFRFFINGYDTRTAGLDIVGSYSTNLGGGHLTLTAAYNYNKSHITNGDPRIVNASLEQEVKDRLPHHTANFAADYQVGRIALSGKMRYFGAFTDTSIYLPPEQNQRFGQEIFVDLSATYTLSSVMKLTVGAENVLNNYPDQYTNLFALAGFKYPTYRPYEADGGRYYARLSAKF